MARTYYTLCTRDGLKGSPWVPQFGDYDRETVKEEMDDYCDREEYASLCIVKSGDTQAEIDARIRELNA